MGTIDYRIKWGDTLGELAQRHNTTVAAIVRANPNKIQNPDLIYAGDTIRIPTGANQAQAGANQVKDGQRNDGPKKGGSAVGGAQGGADQTKNDPPKIPPPPVTPPAAPGTATTAAPVVETPTVEPASAAAAPASGTPTAPATNHVTPGVGNQTYALTQPATGQQYVGLPSTMAYNDAAVAPAAIRSYEEPWEQRVVDLVNIERSRYGLNPVRYDYRLDRSAEGHTVHQARVGIMAHEGIGDGTPESRIRQQGFRGAWGENVATGQTSPEQVVAEWMASPTHRANILNPHFTLLSVAVALDQFLRTFWTQHFGVE